ncbi:Metallo-hydrolase/oxidoreductase [Dendrothele bispora CBS 962.96]|uniref:Metallo-hydrolase/oxidoreductase n=1 Tax=Dendrothele bispora (strain CBS 962.96) TaxID=1314807 RepID=A0A4S8MPX3_DENBC|nr:Metallo-hydrolase/oxidoreductase [Dendrothele bispora CBS 962.96]
MSAVPAAKPCKLHKGVADVYSFFEPATESWQYLLVDPASSEAAIIDPVLDYNPASGVVSTGTAEGILSFITENGFKVRRVLETHAHADHLTASQFFKKHLPGEILICIGERISQIQKHFAPIYDFSDKDMENHFDVLLKDDEEFKLGGISCKVMHLPGHTPDHLGYVVGKAVFTGDSIFMPDLGSARADFPGGNAKDLYNSMTRLLSLPEDYQLFVGHDYPPQQREHDCVATVGFHRQNNKHGRIGITEEQFIEFRQTRDRVLGTPRLLHPSLQVNIRAGKLPSPDADGRIRMRIPVRLPSSML